MAKLILVPTPIGNLEDITLRSIRMLKEADVIYAEDTRVTKKLLSHLEIQKQVIPFHAHNEHRSLDRVISQIQGSENTVLVSDAGTPAISDPGFLLVRECVKEGIEVECLPGPTAFVPALVTSGLPCDRFVFEGFLPQKKGRQTKFKEMAEEQRTIVLYESPHRLVKCLGQICEFMGEDRPVSVSREITKMFEEHIRGTAKEVLEHYEQHPPKGEIVVIIGKTEKDKHGKD